MIDINQVYETVLTILNKEQRGYLDAEEFNNLARIAQREIFEAYFLKFMAAPMMGPVVADPQMFIDEKISYLETELEWDEDENTESYFSFPADLYRLGAVFNRENDVVVDLVHHKDAAYLIKSPFTTPTFSQPIYVIHNQGIQVYPKDDENAVTKLRAIYIKTPTDPNWTYIIDDDGDIVYNPEDEALQSFELHPSEFHELVIKICAYAGVVVRAQDVTQFAQQKEGMIKQDEQ